MRLSGSSLWRTVACPASAVLPAVHEQTAAMERGSALHEYLAHVGAIGREHALATVPPDWRAWAEAIPVDALPVDATQMAAEVALAWDSATDTGRELGRQLDRRYPELRPTEIPGTVDALGVSPEGIYLVEWKTGRTWREWQIRFLALAACRAYRRDRAICDVIFLREDGSIYRERRTYDAFDLAAAADELRHALAQVRAAEERVQAGQAPDVQAGEHCAGCPSYGACPAKVALVRQAVGAPATYRDELRALLPAQVGEAWTRCMAALQMLHILRAEIEALVLETGQPIPLPSGRVLGPVETTRETITDGRAVWDLLSREYGPDVAAAATEMRSSKAAITRALQVVAAQSGGQVAPLQRALLAELRERGALVSRTTTSVRESGAPDEEGAS